jgi:hypothetical protein
MVEVDPLGHHDEPGREFAAVAGGIASQPAKIIAAELFEQVGVAVHDRVLVAAERTRDVEEQPGMGAEESLPAGFQHSRIAGIEGPSRSEREHTRHGRPSEREIAQPRTVVGGRPLRTASLALYLCYLEILA